MRYAQSDERTAVGARIDPATAAVWFEYAQVVDPYGELELTPEMDCVGREWFAADPVERIAVHFEDLPAATRDALRSDERPRCFACGAVLPRPTPFSNDH